MSDPADCYDPGSVDLDAQRLRDDLECVWDQESYLRDQLRHIQDDIRRTKLTKRGIFDALEELQEKKEGRPMCEHEDSPTLESLTDDLKAVKDRIEVLVDRTLNLDKRVQDLEIESIQ